MTYRDNQVPENRDNKLVVPSAADYRDIMPAFLSGGYDTEFTERRVRLILEHVKENMQTILAESAFSTRAKDSRVRFKITLPVSKAECAHSGDETRRIIVHSVDTVVQLLHKDGGWDVNGYIWWLDSHEKYGVWPFCKSTKVAVEYALILRRPS